MRIGNLTNAPLTNDTFAAYAYDARNRLSNAGGVTNAYDAMNNRIGQIYGTNATIFVVNPNAKLPQVLMRIKNGVTTYYVYGAGLLYQVTETATATNTLTYHYDYRGSTVALDRRQRQRDRPHRIQPIWTDDISRRNERHAVPVQWALRRNDRSERVALHAGAILQPISLPVPKS